MLHVPHIPHLFKHRLSLQLEELYLTAGLMDFAGSAITLFEPIYLWTLGYDIRQIMVFYLMTYVAYFFAAPLGGKFIARVGSERSILISTFWLVGYFLALIGIAKNPTLFYIAPFLLTMQKTFYWPAYHFEFMRFAAKDDRGSEFSGLWAVSTVMYVLGPVIGGIVVKFFGFPALFIGAMGVILLSSMPLFVRRPLPKIEPYSYVKSLILPFRRRYWRMSVGYLALGSELILLSVWPIFILTVFGDLFNVGALVGISAFLTAIATLIIGKWTDRSSKPKMIHNYGLLNTGVWLLRLVSKFPPVVFTMDVFGRIMNNALFVSVTTHTYDRAHEDDYSWHAVYYEQGFAIAKSLAAGLVILLASLGDPFQVSFVVAALLSLFHLVV